MDPFDRLLLYRHGFRDGASGMMRRYEEGTVLPMTSDELEALERKVGIGEVLVPSEALPLIRLARRGLRANPACSRGQPGCMPDMKHTHCPRCHVRLGHLLSNPNPESREATQHDRRPAASTGGTSMNRRERRAQKLVRHKARPGSIGPMPEGVVKTHGHEHHAVDVAYERLLHECEGHIHFLIEGYEVEIKKRDILEHDGENRKLCVLACVVEHA